MGEEKFILEINPRTKEKKKIDLLDYNIDQDFTIRDLINEHNEMKKCIKKQNEIINAVIKTFLNLNKSTAVQIADIKEEIK